MSRDVSGIAAPPSTQPKPTLPLDFGPGPLGSPQVGSPPVGSPPAAFLDDGDDWEQDEITGAGWAPAGALDVGLLLLSAAVGGLAALGIAATLALAVWLS